MTQGTKTSISIVLASFNGEKYIAAQLRSFIEQTSLPGELIVYDDHSSDATAEIVKKFKEISPFNIKLTVNENNLGYTQNFSNALCSCVGDIVFLSDQDDVWLPTKIEKMLSRFEADPKLQLLIHDLDYCKEDLTPIGQTKIERMEGHFDLKRDYVVGMATAVRGSFLRHCLPVPKESGITHDYWLHSCACAVDGKEIMRDVLALYRRHPTNATGRDDLNVEFVTTPSYFSSRTASHIQLVKTKTVLGSTELPPLITWLQKKRDALIAEGYTFGDRIDSIVKNGIRCTGAVRVRKNMLALPRWKRLLPMSRLIRNGDYKYFNGWKSLLKDILIN